MSKSKSEKFNVKRTLHYYWKALSQHKIIATILFLTVPVYIFIDNILFPKAISQIIAQLGSGDFEFSHYTSMLLLAIVPTTINNLLLMRVLDYLDWVLDAKCGEYLDRLCFSAIINQSMTFHSDHFSGSLTSQANRMSSSFIDFKSHFVWDIFPFTLTIIYIIVSAWLVCPPIAAILLAFIIVYSAISITTFVKTQKYDGLVSTASNKQTGQLADSITNVLSVKSYAREKYEKERFGRTTKNTVEATLKSAKVSNLRNFGLNVINISTFAGSLVLIIMAHNLYGLSVADTVFLYTIMNNLTSRVWSLNHILRAINRCFGSAKEIVDILDLPYIVDDKTDIPLVVNEANIEFSHISFKHDEKKTKLFDDFSLNIRAGERIGLVGVSGSGKTTLTKLLLRFADVNNGAIFIDGKDIRDVTQESLRLNIAYVPQESSLFHRSVKENIAYGKPDATDEEIFTAAKLANADDFIKDLPDGYETLVGERGVKLSGGQRQRIAIARAILKNAPILVLDEATSALDSESEALIQEALDNLMQNRTSIVVAHRLSTIANLDRIVVLDNGKIVETGTHQELLDQNGTYSKLWRRQSGAFLKDDNH